ncbi:MAG: hypothetical protein ACP5NQ_05585 [Vulcanisaeta sp.]
MPIVDYLRLFYLYLKQRYSVWFLLVLLMIAVFEVLDLTVNSTYVSNSLVYVDVYQYVLFLLFLDFVVIITMVVTVFFMPTYFSRSEIEFVFTTQWSPESFIVMKVFGDGVYIMLLILVLSIDYALRFIMVSHQLSLIPLYVINILLLSFIISGLLLYLHTLNMPIKIVIASLFILYLVLSTFFDIKVNVLFSVIEPMPQYTAFITMVFVFMVVFLRKLAKDISVNVYGLYQGHEVMGRGSLFDGVNNVFHAIFKTSMYSQPSNRRIAIPLRINSLLIAMPLSTFFAIMYGMVIVRDKASLDFVNFMVYYVPFYIMLLVSLMLGSTLTFERPWINLTSGIDHMTYVRLRMKSRLIITYLVTMPWVITNAILYCLLHNVSLVMVNLPLLSYPLLLVPTSWLLMAVSELPQTRDLVLDYRPVKFGVSGMISGIVVTVIVGVLLMPMLIHQYVGLNTVLTWISLLMELSLSIMTYVLLLYTRFGARIWAWFLDKLSMIGYS